MNSDPAPRSLSRSPSLPCKGYGVTGSAIQKLLEKQGVTEGDVRRLGGDASAGRQVWAGKPLQDVLLGAWVAECCSPDLYPSRWSAQPDPGRNSG